MRSVWRHDQSKRLLHRRGDQAQPAGQGHLGAERVERGLGAEQAIGAIDVGGHHGLQEALQGRIHPGYAHEHRAPAAILGKAQLVTLDPHGFVHVRGEGGMEQQSSGSVRHGASPSPLPSWERR